MVFSFCLIKRQHPRSYLPDPLFPYTTLFGAFVPAAPRNMWQEAQSFERNSARPRSVSGVAGDCAGCRCCSCHRAKSDCDMAMAYIAILACCSPQNRSEEHTSELQSLMRISYAVLCLKKKTTTYYTLHPT